MILVVLVFLLVLAGLVDQFVLDDRDAAEGSSQPGPVLSNAWYCVPPSIRGSESEVSATNLGVTPLRLRRRVFSMGSESEARSDQLEAHRSGSALLADFDTPEAAMFVEAFGVASFVDSLTYLRRSGAGAPACTVQPSDIWFFAHGSTQRGLDTHLLVANPFNEEAVIEVRIMGPESDLLPAGLSDLVIAPLSVRDVLIGEFVLEELPRLGLRVRATRGRVVITRFMHDTDGVVTGLATTLGVSRTSARWHFAGGEVPKTGEERILIANPGDSEALVDVTFLTDEESIAPDELNDVPVPAGRQISIDVSKHLPRGTLHGTSVVSTNGVLIVAERETEGELRFGSGRDIVLGSPSVGSRWILSVGSLQGGREELSIANFGSERATVRIALLGTDGESRPEELSTLTIEPGRKLAVEVTAFLNGKAATAVIEAVVGEVTVERRIFMPSPYSDFADGQGRPFD